MSKVLKVIFYGYGLLTLAFFTNFAALKIGLPSWYDLVGPTQVSDFTIFEILWLILLYPLILGLLVYFLTIVFANLKKGGK